MTKSVFILFFTLSIVRSINATILPFKIYLTKERTTVSERFGTFKIKRRLEEVCYPLSIKRAGHENVNISFPQCSLELRVKTDHQQTWKFSSIKEKGKNQYYIHLIFQGDSKDHYYGLGTQYTHLLLDGKKIEAISQEQGNGRGLQPISRIQSILTPGIQGNSFSTYHSNGLVHSSSGRSFLFLTQQFLELDFSYGDRFKASHHGLDFELKLTSSTNIRGALEVTSKWLGKQAPLPEWFHKGPIVGLMNSQNFDARIENFFLQTTKPTGVWLQDWVGTRGTFLGPRLNWDWRLDRSQYPQWDLLRDTIETKGANIMGYFNPYLSKVKQREGNGLFEEALKKDFLLKHKGEVYLVEMGGFKAALVNLLKPTAYQWLKSILKNQIRLTKMKGWMADFGEAYPYEESSFINHHKYITLWSLLNKEVRQELAREGYHNLVSFHRSGSTTSVAHTSAMWLGDQTTTYDNFDGLQSTITGLLSSSLSAVAYNHSDIGGYFGIKVPFVTNIKRTDQLLRRWLEVNAFTMIFRSHLGLNPGLFSQLDSNEQTMGSYNFYAEIFEALFSYRLDLITEYNATGIAPVRPLFISFPEDQETYSIENQFMLGDYVLICPIFQDYAAKKRLYLPKGNWINLWTHQKIESEGEWIEASVEDNKSPVYYRAHRSLNALIELTSTPLFQD